MKDRFGIGGGLPDSIAETISLVKSIHDPQEELRAAIDRSAFSQIRSIISQDPELMVSPLQRAEQKFVMALNEEAERVRRSLDFNHTSVASQLDQLTPEASPFNALQIALQFYRSSIPHGVDSLGDFKSPIGMLEQRSRLWSGFNTDISALNMVKTMIQSSLNTEHPIRSMFDRIGVDSSRIIDELTEPPGLQLLRDTLAQYQTEDIGLQPITKRLTASLSELDLERIDRLLGHSSSIAEMEFDNEDTDDGWDTEPISWEESALRDATPTILEAFQATDTSSADRDAKIMHAVEVLTHLLELMRSSFQQSKPSRKKRAVYKIIDIILTVIVYHWIGSHTTPIIDRSIDALFGEPISTQTQPSQIRRDAAEALKLGGISADELRHLRVVVRRISPVFIEPKSGACEIARLPSGQVVSIIEKQQKWRLIEWQDAENAEYHYGWVRAKYIAKINK